MSSMRRETVIKIGIVYVVLQAFFLALWVIAFVSSPQTPVKKVNVVGQPINSTIMGKFVSFVADLYGRLEPVVTGGFRHYPRFVNISVGNYVIELDYYPCGQDCRATLYYGGNIVAKYVCLRYRNYTTVCTLDVVNAELLSDFVDFVSG